MKAPHFPLIIMIFLPAAAAVAQPTITDLGVLSGGVTSEAFALSTDGSVVVGVSQSADGQRAFRWTPFAGMVSLGTVNGDSTVATGVSDDGNVITGSSVNANGGIAFRWTPASGIAALGTLPGGQLSYGFGVSGNGAVLVGYSDAPARGYRWTQAGGMQNLGTLPGANSSEAYGVSWDGSAVAGYTFTSFAGHAARWTSADGWQDLGTLSQGNGSISRAISGNGQVVVGEDWMPGQPGHAFRWTAGRHPGLGNDPWRQLLRCARSQLGWLHRCG
jgi:probable HAF family extracellular repeat protein